MLHRLTGALRFQVGGFELEVPFGGAVSVVDEHEVRIVLQAFGLKFHSAAILLDEFPENKFHQFRDQRDPAEEIPGGDNVDAAVTAGDGRDGRQAGKPIFSGADGFGAQVGENEVDGGCDGVGVGVEAEKLVGRGV